MSEATRAAIIRLDSSKIRVAKKLEEDLVDNDRLLCHQSLFFVLKVFQTLLVS